MNMQRLWSRIHSFDASHLARGISARAVSGAQQWGAAQRLNPAVAGQPVGVLGAGQDAVVIRAGLHFGADGEVESGHTDDDDLVRLVSHSSAEGFDDVIFVSSEGAVLEGPRATVVAVYSDTLVTPPTEIGILESTTVRAVFDVAEQEGWTTKTDVLRPEDLVAADSVWLVSSVTLAARVTHLNRYVMPLAADAAKFTDLVDRAISVDDN